MSDLERALMGLGAAVWSKDLLIKLLGPTADYLGETVKSFTQKRIENISRIFLKAQKKLGDQVENDGAVPPRILKEIINEGSFVDDELSAEYFGGILASSRSGIKRDDRVISTLKLIEALSTYEIRSHYLFYAFLKIIFNGDNILISNESSKLRLFIPMNAYLKGMALTDKEKKGIILGHVLAGLSNKGLIAHYCAGEADFINKSGFESVDSEGIIFTGTPLGVQLFLMANGERDLEENAFCSESFIFRPIEGVFLSNEAKKLISPIPVPTMPTMYTSKRVS